MSRPAVVSIALLTTGGTIATTSQGGVSAPTLDESDLAALASSTAVSLLPRELAREPSWALDPIAMAEIALAARDVAREPGVDGVVVTHGTTTLEYTAFLASLITNEATPVVLTGAMRRADDPKADGPRNLADAIHVAASPEARGAGPLVVFAGRVIAAGRAWKAHRSAIDAFVDLDGDVGTVRDGRLTIHGRPPRRGTFSGRLDVRVSLLKAVPGQDESLLKAVAALDSIRGLVLEGLPGVGGVPRPMHGLLASMASRMPVVLASRAPYGRVPPRPTGGTGDPLARMGLLSAGDLTAEQAWLLLMASLGDAPTPAAARELFERSAVGSEHGVQRR